MVRKNEKELKHLSRRTSIKEGIYAHSSVSLGDRFISPFAIAINASSSLVAMLSSVTGFLGPLSQVFGSRLIKKHSRKKIVLRSFLLQSLLWLPLIAVAVLFHIGIIIDFLPILLLVFFSFLVISSSFGHPAWFSWMGDIVDQKYRGRWFSKRNLLTGFVSISLAIAASFMLDYFRKQDQAIFGFIILFSLAFLAKVMAWRTFKKQYEPKAKSIEGNHLSFWEFLRGLPKTNFGRFTMFRGFLAFSMAISSPLVAVYLLRHLEFSYLIYILITMAGGLFSLISLKFWGKISDKYGSFRVIALATIVTPLVPLFWILSESPIYLILIPSTLGGIAWSGFLLGAGNFIYDNIDQKKRGTMISYYNMVVGKGIFLGAGLGALLIRFLTIEIVEPLYAIFIIGALARMLVVYVFIPKIKEVRKTRKFKGVSSLKDILLHETKPTLIEEAHDIMHIRKYI